MRGYILIGLILLIVVISGCNNPFTGCTKEAKVCPDGSGVGRNPWRLCAFDSCPKTYTCQQDSDCVIGIRIDSCCSCPSAYPKSQLEDDKNIVIYEYGKDYSSLITSDEDCRKLACEPCLSPSDADIKCVNNKCKMTQEISKCESIGGYCQNRVVAHGCKEDFEFNEKYNCTSHFFICCAPKEI